MACDESRVVTGGAGFIPSNLIRHLLEHTPHEVISLDALTYAASIENLADVMSHPRLEFVHGDIRDAGLVDEVVSGVDVIVNAAAESHVEKSIRDGASEFVTTNVEGTQILLDAIRACPVERFLLVSSSEVYGTAEYAPMDERHPLEPRSPYAATKAGADRLAYSYWVTYDLPIVVVRPFNNFGPRQHPEKVVPRFVTQALSGEPLTVHGDGHASRDWLYVDDTASAIEALIEAPLESVAGEVVNVATGTDISVGDIAQLVLEAVGDSHDRRRPRRRAARPGRPAHRLHRQARATDRLARLDLLHGRPRAHDRLVPRQRGLVARDPGARPRLLVLGAGPAQLGLLEAASARGDLDVIAVDRDPRRARLPARGRARGALVRGRGGDRPARARAARRRDRLARRRLAGGDRGSRRGADRAASPDRRAHRRRRDVEGPPARGVRRGGRAPCAGVRPARAGRRVPGGREGARPAGAAWARARALAGGARAGNRGGASGVALRCGARRAAGRRARADGQRRSRWTGGSRR